MKRSKREKAYHHISIQKLAQAFESQFFAHIQFSDEQQKQHEKLIFEEQARQNKSSQPLGIRASQVTL
jgi:hypothetical protein